MDDDIDGELGANRADLLLARVTVAPALLLAAWLVVALPLLMAGIFRPWAAIPLYVPVAALALRFGLRAVRPSGRRPEGRREGGSSHWPLIWLLVVAAAFGAFQLVMCSQQIVVRRDPASYFNFATWLAHHGSLPIPQMRWAFGGGDGALTYGSPAFYQRGGVLVPQFMAGMPLTVTPGAWIGGPYATLAMMPLIGALALISFAGVAGRLIGPRWAPVAALALGLTWPMMMISRSIYSETGALILMFGGVALVLDAVRSGRRLPALLGGLALGLTILVRIDGIRDVLPVVAFAGLLLALRRRVGLPLAAGLTAGVGAGLLEAVVMSRPYLHYLSASLHPLLYIAVAVVAATAVVGLAVRRWGLPDLTRFRLPDLALPATFAMLAFFAARPMFQTVRRVPNNPDDRVNASFIAALQRSQNLPLDPNRQYSELSLHWVAWYIGIPAVLLAAVGAALVLRDLLLRRRTAWLLPYALIVWTTVATLWRPGITPDHPWASRRLIGMVIPGLLLFALWAAAWLARQARRFLPDRRRVAAVVAVTGALLILAPTAWASAPMSVMRTEEREVSQAQAMCRAIGPNASVLFVERVTGDRFAQLIRGMCGTPTARVRIAAGFKNPTENDVRRVVQKVAAAGRRPVLLGADSVDVAPYGQARRVFHIHTRRDASTLVSAPRTTWSLTINVWMSVPVYGR
ncbi:hypothetical protein [Actinoallomurus rhizosphaericola]|uniref:hypothetical protein n=1 Tax=Actinoallomurus rhizosphaericola TaxID=2952536 RepID=UPI00209381B2|nr:hypothetical protein [Actinoallomurus rhizosphaericola]MCO5998706.1 hypothetical protein [Actinoallomurus rhizosphaericola]